jgi:hypothetical protein
VDPPLTLSSLATKSVQKCDALERFYRTLHSPTYNFVRCRVNDRETAGDLTSRLIIRRLEESDTSDRPPPRP